VQLTAGTGIAVGALLVLCVSAGPALSAPATQIAPFIRYAILLEQDAQHNRTSDKARAQAELAGALQMLQQAMALGPPADAQTDLQHALTKDDDALHLLPTANDAKVRLDLATALNAKDAALTALGEPVTGPAIPPEPKQAAPKPLPPEPKLPVLPPIKIGKPVTGQPTPVPVAETTREKVIKLVNAALAKENDSAAAFDETADPIRGYRLLEASVGDLEAAEEEAALDPALRAAENQIHDALDHDYEIGAVLFGFSGACIDCEAEDAYDHKLNALEDLGVHVGAPTVLIQRMTSVFVPIELATKYTVSTLAHVRAKLTYDWVLSLGLVDFPGAAPPGNPDSGAAFDPTCNNAYLAGGMLESFDQWSDTYVWTKLGADFTWYHGDKGSYLPSAYGCDHHKMGPSGHQGIVSVTVSDGTWSCTATTDGSNLGLVPEDGFVSPCLYEPR
jgi:tetratricopeptide (TPR) repeat protein